MIIKTQKVDPRTQGWARILIKESDRKSSTDKYLCMSVRNIREKKNLLHFEVAKLKSEICILNDEKSFIELAPYFRYPIRFSVFLRRQIHE